MGIFSNELRKFVSPELLFGAGALRACPAYINNLGGGRVLLVSDRGLEEAGWPALLEGVLDDAGIDYTSFYDVIPNPRDFEVQKGYEIYLDNACDMIVALGGGSPMDCAKGIGIIVSNKGSIRDYEGADNVPVPMPPLICIPTTAGSSADVSQFAIINNTEDFYKMAIISKSIVPDISLIDPELSVTMDAELTAETGLDALTHAFEAYVSNASSPITDLNAAEAIKIISRYLLKAFNEPEDPEARSAMMLGSMYAGLAFSNASLGLVHSMAHALGGLLDLPHGLCNALLLEHVAEYNFNAVPGKYRRIAEFFTGSDLTGESDSGVCEILVDNLKGLRKSLMIGDRIAPGTVEPSGLEKLARKALNDACIVTNPVEPSFEDVISLYEKII